MKNSRVSLTTGSIIEHKNFGKGTILSCTSHNLVVGFEWNIATARKTLTIPEDIDGSIRIVEGNTLGKMLNEKGLNECNKCHFLYLNDKLHDVEGRSVCSQCFQKDSQAVCAANRGDNFERGIEIGFRSKLYCPKIKAHYVIEFDRG